MQVFFVISVAFLTEFGVGLGLGQHAIDLKEIMHQAHQILQWSVLYNIFTVLATLFTKYSICCFILRLKNDRYLKLVFGTFMLLMTLVTVVMIAVLGLSCAGQPVSPDGAPPTGCVSLPATFIVLNIQSGFTIVIDLALTASPVFVLWNVRMPPGRKVFVVVLMSFGLVATVSNALRNYALSDSVWKDLSRKWTRINFIDTLTHTSYT